MKAAEWLKKQLADGRWHECLKLSVAADAEGIGPQALGRAVKELGAETKHEREGDDLYFSIRLKAA